MAGFAVIAVIVVPLVVYPLVRIVLEAIHPTLGTPGEFSAAFSDPQLGSAIRGTLLTGGVSVVVATPLGVLLAWICSSTDAPFARRLASLPVICLAMSPLIGALGWLVLLDPRVGLANLAFRGIFGSHSTTGPFNAFSVVVILGLTSIYVVPYVYAPVYAAFRQLDGSLQEAAAVCGARPLTVARTVVLPILRPAIVSGALIAGAIGSSLLSVVLLLSSGTSITTLALVIYNYVVAQGQTGTAIGDSTILVGITLVGTLVATYAMRGGWATVGGRGVRPHVTQLRRMRVPATAFVLAFLFIALVAPLLALLYFSFVPNFQGTLVWPSASLVEYRAAFAFPAAWSSFFNSLWFAAAAATIAVAAGFAIGLVRRRDRSRVVGALSLISTIPLGIPGIVFGLAVLLGFTGPPFPLYGTAAILILAYCGHMLPISVQQAQAGLSRLGPEVEEAARIAGDSAAGAIRRVLVPLSRRVLGAGWALIFIMLFRDLEISTMLYTYHTDVSSVTLVGIFNEVGTQGAAAFAMPMTAVSMAFAGVALWVGDRDAG
jgi:iron(III) transport system permease protein